MSIEQKIAEMLAESKAKQSALTEEVKEMGAQSGPSDKVTASQSAQEPSNIAGYADGVTEVDGDEESNAKNAVKDQSAATNSTTKKPNVTTAKATAPEASHLSGVKEDVDALLNGEELSEEFREKATTIFEAAVLSRVAAEKAVLEEAYESKLQEEVETIKEGLVEKVDGYLGYIVEQWVQENELALESGMKSEVMESFVEGMKSLFAEHYIEVPEERFDILGDMQEQLETLEAKLNEQLEKNVEMAKEINEAKRIASIEESTAGLTDTDAEKFKALAEEISYESAEAFSTKLQTIRENYFGGKKVIAEVKSVVTDTPVETLNETAPIDPSIKRYLSALDKLK